jgi:hypothetical protein
MHRRGGLQFQEPDPGNPFGPTGTALRHQDGESKEGSAGARADNDPAPALELQVDILFWVRSVVEGYGPRLGTIDRERSFECPAKDSAGPIDAKADVCAACHTVEGLQEDVALEKGRQEGKPVP